MIERRVRIIYSDVLINRLAAISCFSISKDHVCCNWIQNKRNHKRVVKSSIENVEHHESKAEFNNLDFRLHLSFTPFHILHSGIYCRFDFI